MTTAEDLIYLVKSHIEGDDERFLSVASQLAAREARQGRTNVAESLRKLIRKARDQAASHQPAPLALTLRVPQPKGELANLLSVSLPRQRISGMVLPKETRERLRRIVEEQKREAQLRSHGLSPRSKVLLVGPPGSGKTLTAGALAGELDLPLMTIQIEGLMTKYMGETASKLKMIFDSTYDNRGIYFFDEFDSIGASRRSPNDVGEIRRVLNSFLQMIEKNESHSLILAATNHIEMLDAALFRRFDDIIEYYPPSEETSIEIIENKLARFDTDEIDWTKIAKSAINLSYAEISKAAEDAAKICILDGRIKITDNDLILSLIDRKQHLGRMK